MSQITRNKIRADAAVIAHMWEIAVADDVLGNG